MQRTSKASLIVLTLVLVLGLAGSAWAQPMGKGMGKGMGRGMGMMNLTPDQAAKLFDLKEKFHTDTAGLRKQMWVKRAEMGALWKAEKPDEKAILAKQKELNALRDQLQEKRLSFVLEAKKIDPNFRGGLGHGFGMGHGCGMGPGGMGMGPGGMGMGPGGMGMGSCPLVPGNVPPPPPPAK